MASTRSTTIQLIASLLLAALIVVVTVRMVASQFPLQVLPNEQSEDGGHGRGDRGGPGGE
jgi:hypothetical protein